MKVNRTKTIKQLLDELEYKQYINEDVLKTIKNEGDKDVKVEFFNLGKYTSNAKVLKEYEKRNLTQDLGAVITYLIENPKTLDEKKYIGVQMKDDVFVSFHCWDGEREVDVGQGDGVWDDLAWFGGRRKSSTLSNSELSEPLPSALPEILTINGIKYKQV